MERVIAKNHTDFDLLLDIAQSIADQNPWAEDDIEVGMGGWHCAYCQARKSLNIHKDDCRWELAVALINKHRPKPKPKTVIKKCLICHKNVHVRRSDDNTGWVVTNAKGEEHKHERSYRYNSMWDDLMLDDNDYGGMW